MTDSILYHDWSHPLRFVLVVHRSVYTDHPQEKPQLVRLSARLTLSSSGGPSRIGERDTQLVYYCVLNTPLFRHGNWTTRSACLRRKAVAPAPTGSVSVDPPGLWLVSVPLLDSQRLVQIYLAIVTALYISSERDFLDWIPRGKFSSGL